MLALICLGLLLTTTGVPVGEDERRVPSRPQPEFAFVGAVDQAAGEVTIIQVRAVTITVPVPGPKGDVRNVLRTELRTIEKKVKLDKASVSDAGGNKLAGKALWARLKKGDKVLLSTDGQAVDPAYLRTLQPSTLILVVPPVAGVPVVPGEPAPGAVVPPGR
jgi:hypothetical protein